MAIMFKRLLTSFVCMVFLLSCSHLHRVKIYTAQPVIIKAVQSFHQIRVVGNLNILLHTNSISPGVKITGDPKDVANVSWLVRLIQDI